MSHPLPDNGLRDSGPFISDTFRRAPLPALLSVGGMMASALANSLIAGNLLGHETLAVLSIANPVYFIFTTIGSLAGVGAASWPPGASGGMTRRGATPQSRWRLCCPWGSVWPWRCWEACF